MASLSANQIKFIRSLQQKKFRDEYGLFLAEGEKIVDEALKSQYKVKEVYYEKEIGRETMARISNLSSPSPVLAIIEKPAINPDSLLSSINIGFQKGSQSDKRPLYLALDGVKDPGNLGTIIRIADWFGIDAIFASPGSVEVYNPKVVQATMGAIFRKQVIYTNLAEVCKRFMEANLPVYGTFLNGNNLYEHLTEENKKGLVVMGSESFGISPELETLINNKLLIPPYPQDSSTSESLNVAIATAIICAEFRR
ncbi:MAG: RNA methyltransferase [Bacteroidales bacterium]|nr:RNA methyltransferase [Bacteroidales bacterium]